MGKWVNPGRSIGLIMGAVCLLNVALPVLADVPETGFWGIQLENDTFGTNDDRYYTSGVEVSFATAEPPPSWAETVPAMLPFYDRSEVGIHGISFGQNMFTPEDTESTELVVDDRPYAGWLYMQTGIAHLVEDTGDRQVINGLGLTLGIVGPGSLAEQTQKGFHSLIGVDDPKGWNNQLHNELGLNVAYLRKWRRLIQLDSGRQFEISHHGGVSLGNVYTYASAGFMARWGTQLKNDIGPPTIGPGFTGLPAFRPDPAFNWYVFAGMEGRLMGRNIFLDGNTFTDSHSVNKEPLVGDLQLGMAFHLHNVRIAFTTIIRSKEFEGQGERAQYGAINLTFYTD